MSIDIMFATLCGVIIGVVITTAVFALAAIRTNKRSRNKLT